MGILRASHHPGRKGAGDRDTDISPTYQTHSACICVVSEHRGDDDKEQPG